MPPVSTPSPIGKRPPERLIKAFMDGDHGIAKFSRLVAQAGSPPGKENAKRGSGNNKKKKRRGNNKKKGKKKGAATGTPVDFNLRVVPWTAPRGEVATLLTEAALRGALGQLKVLLAVEGIDPNRASKPRGATPLYVAAQEDRVDAIELLLGHSKIDVNQPTAAQGATPLFVAAQNGFLGSVQPVEILCRTLFFRSNTLHLHSSLRPDAHSRCVLRGSFDRLLLGVDRIDVNKATKAGATNELLLSRERLSRMTPLFRAAQLGRAAVVRVLVGRDGIDLGRRGEAQEEIGPETPLEVARRRGHWDVVKVLEAAAAGGGKNDEDAEPDEPQQEDPDDNDEQGNDDHAPPEEEETDGSSDSSSSPRFEELD